MVDNYCSPIGPAQTSVSRVKWDTLLAEHERYRAALTYIMEGEWCDADEMYIRGKASDALGVVPSWMRDD